MRSNRDMDCKRFLSPKEASELLGLHPETIRRHVREGSIPSVKAFRKVLIPSEFFSYTDSNPCRTSVSEEDKG